MAKKNPKKCCPETKLLKNWLEMNDPLAIATHQDVDADATFSAALLHTLRPNAAVVFLRVDAEVTAKEVIAVDMMTGPRAVKGLNVGSAFGLIVATIHQSHPLLFKALKPWAKQLNLTDQAKPCYDNVVLADLVNAWKAAGLNDREILDQAVLILEGKWKVAKRRAQQTNRAKAISIKNRVAVLGKDDHVRAKDMFKLGALAVVRESEQGLSVVLSKKAKQKGVRLNVLQEKLDDGWFFHPDGWLASFGGPKTPKNPEEAGVSVKVLTQCAKMLVAEVKQ